MKILHSIWSLAPENGGPTRSTIGICKALGKAGVDVALISHVPHTVSLAEQDSLRACGVSFFEGTGNGLLPALSDSRRLIREIRPDIVHIQGLWKMSTHAMGIAAYGAGKSMVVSPRGMLDPWALSVKKWKKRLGMLLYQDADLRHAAAFHATAEQEVSHIRAAGYGQPCIVAPNGVDLPQNMPTGKRNGEIRTAVFLSRLHPGKGLVELAKAWHKVSPKGWRMRVVGPDSYDHKKDVIQVLESLGIRDEWTFDGALDDAAKWSAYASADLLVHPSVSENFGITIAEGLGAGLPVIATKGAPWAELQERKCGWWVDLGVEPLARALGEAMSLDDATRQEMGERGRRLIAEKYTWDAVVKKIIEGYEKILGNA